MCLESLLQHAKGPLPAVSPVPPVSDAQHSEGFSAKRSGASALERFAHSAFKPFRIVGYSGLRHYNFGRVSGTLRFALCEVKWRVHARFSLR